jgi:type I restriction enzyme S subunit
MLEHAATSGYRVCPKSERSKGPAGPDILLEREGNRIWIEAVAVTRGDPSKADSLVEPNPPEIPEEKIVLRYTSAIGEKYRKYFRYLEKRIVNEADAYVVALNGSALGYWQSPAWDVPRFLKALYPIGKPQLLLDKKSREVVDTGNQPRFTIVKAQGSPVSRQAFIDRRWRGISAVIHSCAHADMGRFCAYEDVRRLGFEFEIAYSPLARQPLSQGVIPAKIEWWSKLSDMEWQLFSERQA